MRPQWIRTSAVVSAALATLIALAVAARHPLPMLGATAGGPLWHMPITFWLAVAIACSIALWSRSLVAMGAGVVALGVATMASLGLVEPLGVFHDSWQNVGLGQLALAPGLAGDLPEIPYVAGSPVSFLMFGLLRGGFGSTPALLRIYPAICVLLYTAGTYTLANSLVVAHPRLQHLDKARTGWAAAFALLALAPLFWMRINPAPQSLAFALMMFCAAALLRAPADGRYRIIALALFLLTIFTHPITAVVFVTLVGAWLLIDIWNRWRTSERSLVSANTMLLYACLFVSWAIYIGVWVIHSSEIFTQRIAAVLHSGQHATVTATVTEHSMAFVWIHRVALLGGAALVVIGMLVVQATCRSTALRLMAWFGIAGAWLPMVLFGEFGDRGPLFASVPAALTIGLGVTLLHHPLQRHGMALLLFLTALTGQITAYPNHIGEVIAESEVAAFDVIVDLSDAQRIAYGYSFPLVHTENLPIYRSTRIRVFAIGAADFTFDRLLAASDVIVLSDQMREAATLRGKRAAAMLEQFDRSMRGQMHFEVIYDSGSVRAYRVR